MDIDIAAVAGLLLFVATGAAASWRGRSVLWGLLVFPLGPLALLVIFALPKRTPKTA